MQIDQRSLQRLYRMGVKGLNNTHTGKVVRRSKSLRHLINGPLGSMGEEALQLLGMEVDGQQAMETCGRDQVGDQLGSDRHASLMLAILPRIAEIRDYGGDAMG